MMLTMRKKNTENKVSLSELKNFKLNFSVISK